jgi:hypothetical protein
MIGNDAGLFWDGLKWSEQGKLFNDMVEASRFCQSLRLSAFDNKVHCFKRLTVPMVIQVKSFSKIDIEKVRNYLMKAIKMEIDGTIPLDDTVIALETDWNELT